MDTDSQQAVGAPLERHVMQHTPGPWAVAGPTKYLNQTQIEPSIGCVYGAGAELVANAALIAAAPDLLAALRRMLESVTGVDQVSAVNEARAAFEKATGCAA